MMYSPSTRRAVADVRAVCQSASPADAARWLTALVTNLPGCARTRSLHLADQAWTRSGATFRTANGVLVSLPAAYTAGAREMYCRNVYLRTGLSMPSSGWVVDLGANHGLFSVWAALSGAQVVAVEAQQGFISVIESLARHNAVIDRVDAQLGLASGITSSGAMQGVVADDTQWAATSRGTPGRPADVSIPQLMSLHNMNRIDLLKIDIEGGEFAVFAADEDLAWLKTVDQIAMELHPDFGDARDLINRICSYGFSVELHDNTGNQVVATSPGLTYAYFC